MDVELLVVPDCRTSPGLLRDINWLGYDDLTPLGAAERSDAADLGEWLRDKGAKPS